MCVCWYHTYKFELYCKKVEVTDHYIFDKKSLFNEEYFNFVKVVKEEDIREFFSGMEARKRQRTTGPMPFMCK